MRSPRPDHARAAPDRWRRTFLIGLVALVPIVGTMAGPLVGTDHALAQPQRPVESDDAGDSREVSEPEESSARTDTPDPDAGTGVADPGGAASDRTGAASDRTGAAGDRTGAGGEPDLWPLLMVAVGIISVLGLIIGFKLNAFLALILSALVVSLLVGARQGEGFGRRMDAVVDAFGTNAGNIGIVIAMAAIIGKCMLDSGAADRIVRSAVGVTGEKKASLGLMLSGFVLAVPVFFDTVFYLLVPLARSLHQRTGRNYLRYLMAIATGGAITHTLVPPTPGPLLVAAILRVDLGVMMLVGVMVALPSALIGLSFSVFVDRRSPVPMRPLAMTAGGHESLAEDRLPSLAVALIPVVLPVLLIGSGTLATTLADRQDRARLLPGDIQDGGALAARLADAPARSPASRVLASGGLSDAEIEFLTTPPQDEPDRRRVAELLNRVISDPDFYDEGAFTGVPISEVAEEKLAADPLRMKPVDRRRMNRTLLEDAFGEVISRHDWNSPARVLANSLALWSNPNFALLLAALVAMGTVKSIRRMSWGGLGGEVETALMSGGLIILITAAGGSFGAMLSDTGIGGTIESAFAGGSGSGIGLILLGWLIASFLKVAQGSSTVAMIVGAGMMAAIIGDSKPEYHMAYVAIAVGSGSLMGSWMNDSGFWVFTKMGGLTEGESLRSWTPLLAILSLAGLAVTILLSQIVPLRG